MGLREDNRHPALLRLARAQFRGGRAARAAVRLSFPSASFAASPSLRVGAHAAWAPRLAAVALFIALCALVTWWVLTFSAMRTIPVPKTARVAQTEAVETGAIATLFGGSPQAGVRDVKLLGVIADVGRGSGAAVVSVDDGPPKALRAGAALSSQIRLVEIRDRSIVIERNGARQTISLPAETPAARGPARQSGAASALPTPPSGAAAPMATPVPANDARATQPGAASEPLVAKP